MQQGDARGPIRIVLDGRNTGWNAVLFAPEVDPAVETLVATTTTTHSDVPNVVSTTDPLFPLGKASEGLNFR